ncbi:hypothetical protein PAAG_08073 [Paracoccidioides lutzii Pb01]|uniref:DUF3844 domain-containing protein n=1 Tax=Paracoccidioides lutzii (strain ATCC MYA-826 / Pb01) TaxID=502779 RepID=C1HBD2_PARBA|nr:hypothetical protein PAAG_08073 [Paracoccidioides lutzii Pb01]EEH37655.1 hypothetical protein PAAG_08073 [Paracoccidioides lutzii Pb01]
MSPTMKSWPVLTSLLILLLGLMASATLQNNEPLQAFTTPELRAERLAVRDPKGGKGGGGGSSSHSSSDNGLTSCPNGGTTCSECFGTGYISCISPRNVCYNPSTQTRSQVCVSSSTSDASQLVAGPLALGAFGLAIAML